MWGEINFLKPYIVQADGLIWEADNEAFDFYIRKLKNILPKNIDLFQNHIEQVSDFDQRIKFIKQVFGKSDKLLLSPNLTPFDNDKLINLLVHHRNIFNVYMIKLSNLNDINEIITLLYELNKIAKLPVWIKFKLDDGDFVETHNKLNLIYNAFSQENNVKLLFDGTMNDTDFNAELYKALIGFCYE